MLLIYSLASEVGEGSDPSPSPVALTPLAAILIAAGIGAILRAVLSRRRGE